MTASEQNARMRSAAQGEPSPRAVRTTRAGLTLIELLVVISIMLGLMSVAIALVANTAQDRAMREGARLVTSMIEGAKAQAVGRNRAIGVMLEPLSTTGGGRRMSSTLHYVEVPPPYAGDTLTSTIVLDRRHEWFFLTGTTPDDIQKRRTGAHRYYFTLSDIAWTGQLRVGDLVQLNHQGFWHILVGPDADDDRVIDTGTEWIIHFRGLVLPSVDQIDVTPAKKYAYQVRRQPVKSASPSVQLPAGVVIDLRHSGIGAGNSRKFSTGKPITFLFSPNGRVRYQTNEGQFASASAPIFLMIGRPEGVNAAGLIKNVDDPTNVEDLNTRWVAIHHQTGLLTPADNLYNPSDASLPAVTSSSTSAELRAYQDALARVGREFAIRGQSMGGR